MGTATERCVALVIYVASISDVHFFHSSLSLHLVNQLPVATDIAGMESRLPPKALLFRILSFSQESTCGCYLELTGKLDKDQIFRRL